MLETHHFALNLALLAKGIFFLQNQNLQKCDALRFCMLVSQYPSENAQQIQMSFIIFSREVKASKIIMFP